MSTMKKTLSYFGGESSDSNVENTSPASKPINSILQLNFTISCSFNTIYLFELSYFMDATRKNDLKVLDLIFCQTSIAK